jgi:hypothetical protein
MTFNEMLETFRRKGISMSYNTLTELLQSDEFWFVDAVQLNEWVYIIWRKPFYEYLEMRGIPMPELDELLEELRAQGWKEEREYDRVYAS